KHPEIILMKNERNSGTHFTFNRGIQAAKNEFIYGSSADDVILPGFFEKAMNLFNKNETLALVCTDFALFHDQKPYQLQARKMLPIPSPVIFTPPDFIQMLRKTNFFIPSNTCIYKIKFLQSFGGYDPKLMSLTDYFLNAQIAFRHPIGYIPEALAAYRIAQNSYGQTIRYDWKKRLQLMDYLMQLIFKKEDKQFQKDFVRSGLLGFNGYFMILYLLIHPTYWRYLPFIIYKVIQRKFEKYE
ncbi:MAG TPA: glycosyltransferase, partial [Chlamydiales bacterium]|nr:glycosyltransferase [Chlamydiales bacterium]